MNPNLVVVLATFINAIIMGYLLEERKDTARLIFLLSLAWTFQRVRPCYIHPKIFQNNNPIEKLTTITRSMIL